MVGVSDKPETHRLARASARVEMATATAAGIADGTFGKGDVLAVARLAGIQAAKRTADLIPLCHPLRITAVEVHLTLRDNGVDIAAEVAAVDRTGVEMEAMTAASTAALTVYDMCKSVDRGMCVANIQLEHKSGGKSGTWDRGGAPDWLQQRSNSPGSD